MKNKILLVLSLIVFLTSSCGFMGNSANATEAVDFSAKDMQGASVSLGEYIGKEPILLVFFATWCPPCRKEVPELIHLNDKYGSQGLKLIATSVDNSANVLNSFIKKHSINYTVWHDSNREGSTAYQVRGIPTNILINKAGEIVYNQHYPPSVNEIESLLE